MLGSWLVDHTARGLSIREDENPVTGNTSRFAACDSVKPICKTGHPTQRAAAATALSGIAPGRTAGEVLGR